jgi:hypothetical protein
MQKPVLVVTHERSGTHLIINIINHLHNGRFSAIGYLPSNKKHDIPTYKDYVYKYVLTNRFDTDVVSKSHHQVEFYEDFIDELFDNYRVIYVQRDIKDTLVSYHKFLNSDDKHKPIPNFPKLEKWIFMNPEKIGYEFFADYPDPHIIIQPKDYIDRLLIHQSGWMRYKDRLLVVNYEDILSNFPSEKLKIESYIGQKIAEKVPSLDDPNLPNFFPNKGIIGSHKKYMSEKLISKIDLILGSK